MRKVKLKDISTIRGSTNWKELRSQSYEEIEGNAKKRYDAKLLNPVELAELRRIKSG